MPAADRVTLRRLGRPRILGIGPPPELEGALAIEDDEQLLLGAVAVRRRALRTRRQRQPVEAAVDRSRLAAEDKDISVSLNATGDCEVWGDHELLVTAVRNLVGNAVAYSDPHTRVAVRVRTVEGADDAQVELAVIDQGQGIPAAEQSRVFERFYRVDAARSRATGGTGLGLSIDKHVAANPGGEVGVWSEPGRGSTFTMRLPAARLGRQRAADARHTDDTVNVPAHRVTEESPA